MTLLRRTAQLVQDLRTLNVLKDDDNIECYLHLNDGMSMKICLGFQNRCEAGREIRMATVRNSIKQEFQEEYVCNVEELEFELSCQLVIKK